MKIIEQAKKFILRYKIAIAVVFGFLIISYIILGSLNKELLATYKSNQSFFVTDRNNEIIFISKNQKGYYAEYSESVPQNFKNSLIKKKTNIFTGILVSIFGVSQKPSGTNWVCLKERPPAQSASSWQRSFWKKKIRETYPTKSKNLFTQLPWNFLTAKKIF